MNAKSFATYLATSTLDLFNTADYNPDRLTLGVSVRDFIMKQGENNCVQYVTGKTGSPETAVCHTTWLLAAFQP